MGVNSAIEKSIFEQLNSEQIGKTLYLSQASQASLFDTLYSILYLPLSLFTSTSASPIPCPSHF